MEGRQAGRETISFFRLIMAYLRTFRVACSDDQEGKGARGEDVCMYVGTQGNATVFLERGRRLCVCT
jgi:hypothetical protein